MDIAKPLKDAFSFLKTNPIAFVPGVLVSLVFLLISLSFAELLANPFSFFMKVIGDPVSYLLYFLVVIAIYGIVNVYSSLWVINLISNKNKYNTSLSQTAYSSLMFLPVAIAASILQFLSIIGGFILLIIPGIFLAVKFIFAEQAIVLDKKGPVSSLNHSWNLVKGRWWETFAFVLILIVLLSFLSIPNSIFQFGAVFNRDLAGLFSILFQIYTFFYTAFSLSFSVSAYTFLYLQMRSTKPKKSL